MITFKELLSRYSIDKIVDYYMTADNLKEEEREETYKTYSSFINTLKAKNTVAVDRVLIGIPYKKFANSENNILCFRKEDVENIKEKSYIKLEDIKDLSEKDLDYYASYKILPKECGFEYKPWEEVISYEIDEENVKEYGELAFIKEVFYKITFFGFDEEYIKEAREAIEMTMQQVDELNTLSEEEKEKRIFTPERAVASFSFQDNRSIEEKQEALNESKRETIRKKIVESNVIKAIFK